MLQSIPLVNCTIEIQNQVKKLSGMVRHTAGQSGQRGGELFESLQRHDICVFRSIDYLTHDTCTKVVFHHESEWWIMEFGESQILHSSEVEDVYRSVQFMSAHWNVLNMTPIDPKNRVQQPGVPVLVTVPPHYQPILEGLPDEDLAEQKESSWCCFFFRSKPSHDSHRDPLLHIEP